MKVVEDKREVSDRILYSGMQWPEFRFEFCF